MILTTNHSRLYMYMYIGIPNDICTHTHLGRFEAMAHNEGQVQQLNFHKAKLENELRQ